MSSKLSYNKIENMGLYEVTNLVIKMAGKNNLKELLSIANILSEERKLIIYKLVAEFYNFDTDSLKEINKDEDKVKFFECVKNSMLMGKYGYYVLLNIKVPKENISEESIKTILEYEKTEFIYTTSGAYFADEILKYKEDYYKLLEIKDKLSEEIITMIYEKASSKEEDYEKVIGYLKDDELKNYTKVFVKIGTNALIAKNIINNKYYFEEDFDALLEVIKNYGDAKVIYNILMSEKLDDKQTKMLEKALLKTSSIEYISYYYFYRNMKEFIKIFGSALLFLSFVYLNKDKFTDETILNDIISKIKDRSSYNEKVQEKVSCLLLNMKKMVKYRKTSL